MSQHAFRSTDCHGRSVLVLAGWDRRLQGFFLQVGLDARPNSEDHWLFDHLSEMDLRRYGVTASFTDSFAEFQPVLDAMGIAVPPAMVAQIEADGRLNVGNRLVDWGSGEPDLLSP